MTGFVLDSSVTLTWCFEDEATETSDRVLEALGETTALVPAVLWELEVWNALLVAARRGRIAMDRLDEFRRLVENLAVMRVPPPLSRAFDLARKHELSSYDATYLALAEQEGLPLATLDRRLLQVCRESGVSVLDAGGSAHE